MLHYRTHLAGLLLLILFLVSCSKESKIEEQASTTIDNSTRTAFFYEGRKYNLLFDNKGLLIPTEESELFQKTIDGKTGMAEFIFLDGEKDAIYLFDSEMEGYKYYEDNFDKRIGRDFQVGHATNLLRDKLYEKYGNIDFDYSNPLIYADAKAGIEDIYNRFNIEGEVSKDLAFFMGELDNNNSSSQTNNRNNNSWRLWEHANRGGDVFNLETEPNVWSWTHGNYNCFKTYAAADLNWNYRQNNQSWNDCISSMEFNFQPGASHMGFAMYKHPHFSQGGCNKMIYPVSAAQFYSGAFKTYHSNLAYSQYHYGGTAFCGSMENTMSSLRMQIIWEGCPIDYSDL